VYEKSFGMRFFLALPCPEKAELALSRAAGLTREGQDEEIGPNGRNWMYSRPPPGCNHGNPG